jgi:hypothetical protein
MSNESNTTSTKRRPDYLAYAVRSVSGEGPHYTRIGVGFSHKNGGLGVMYDAVPLSGQIVLIEPDAEKPATISYGHPTRKPDFEANMVRDGAGDKSYWTSVGSAYRQEGYISILLDVVPHSKLVLSVPKEQEA